MSLASQISALATRVGQEFKAVRAEIAALPSGGGSGAITKGAPIVTAAGSFFTYPNGTATTVGAQTLSQTRYVPVYFAGGTLSEILFRVSTVVASATLRIGIYNSAGPNGLPGALVADFEQQAATVAGLKSVPVSTVLTAGWYWVATTAQVAAANVGTVTAPFPGFPYNGNPVVGSEHICYVNPTLNTGAYPASAPTTMTPQNAGTVAANVPRLWFKYSDIS